MSPKRHAPPGAARRDTSKAWSEWDGVGPPPEELRSNKSPLEQQVEVLGKLEAIRARGPAIGVKAGKRSGEVRLANEEKKRLPEVRKLHNEGLTQQEIADELGYDVKTVRKYLKKNLPKQGMN